MVSKQEGPRSQAQRHRGTKAQRHKGKEQDLGNRIIKALGTRHWALGKIKKKVVGQAVNRYGGELPDKNL